MDQSNENQIYLQKQKDELVWQVDQFDNPIGGIKRGERGDQTISRCTYIFLLNQENKIYIHKRTPLKQWCPSHWDPAFGGVVGYNESYELNAERELFEEAGVQTKDLKLLFKFYYSGYGNPSWCAVFEHKTEQKELILQKEEVEKVSTIFPQEYQQFLQNLNEPITPDGKMAIEMYIKFKQIQIQ